MTKRDERLIKALNNLIKDQAATKGEIENAKDKLNKILNKYQKDEKVENEKNENKKNENENKDENKKYKNIKDLYKEIRDNLKESGHKIKNMSKMSKEELIFIVLELNLEINIYKN